MKLTAKASAALTAAVVVVIAGAASITISRTAPTDQVVAAAPSKHTVTVTVPPSVASSAIGIAPTNDSPTATGRPSLLGTVFTFRWANTKVHVQATAADTTAIGSASSTRQVSAFVNYTAVTGTITYAPTDFTMLDQTGTRYPSQTTGSSSEPLLGIGTLNQGGTTEGAVLFQVPATAAALTLAYAPAPSHTTIGVWTLSAP